MSLSRTGRAILVGVVLAASSSIALPSASAHASLVSSSPSEGDVLDAPPQTITLTFTDELMDVAPAIVVLDDDGTVVDKPEPRVEGDTLYADGPDDLLPGDYAIGYRVVSEDGHPVDGEIPFTIEGKPAPTTSAPSSPTATAGATASSQATSGSTSASSGATEDGGASSTESASDDGLGPWAFAAALAAVVAVLAAAGIWLTRRRRHDTTTPSNPTSGDSA